MKLFVFFLVVSMAGFAVAQPTDILVYHEVEDGYGDAVLTAISNLWPYCIIADYSGGEAGMIAFNAELAGTWDMILIECWYHDTDDLMWGSINDIYDTGVTPIFATCWEWTGGTSGQLALANAMGVSSMSSISGSVIPHYAWEPTHVICDGISDWGWNDPGLLTLNWQFTVSDAMPVTGWSNMPAPGSAGICVANDGQSVISGYVPAYANESVAIWENILEFMYGGGGALEQSTWGAIKANF